MKVFLASIALISLMAVCVLGLSYVVTRAASEAPHFIGTFAAQIHAAYEKGSQ
jgi:hypothetical protein